MKIVCVDSFKFEYLRYAPYLKSLSERYAHGRLKTCLGFWGGMETFFKGRSDILAFFYYSERSSWRFVRYFSLLGRFFVNLLINFFRFLKGEVLFWSYEIPAKKMHMFDTDVKKSFYHGLKVEYVHIGKLDKISHKYGVDSLETRRCVEEIDNMLRKVDFDLVMSDHGMMDVKEIIKVPECERCFIDSTMARYWGDDRDIKKLKLNLPLDKGKRIKWNKKYGDLIFLANPGVLIMPNYWQGGNRVRAMHGYDPGSKEMDGFYILLREGKRKDLEMIELHEKVFR